MTTEEIVQFFLEALVANTQVAYERILAEDCSLRAWRWDGSEAHRPRQRVIARMMEEWSGWPDPHLETFSILSDLARAAIEYRIQATEHDRYVEHNRSAFLTIADGGITTIDLYCAEPIPSARRNNTIAPASLTEPEVHALLKGFQNAADIREYVTPNVDHLDSQRIRLDETGNPHPGSNDVRLAGWTEEEADQRIDEVIEYHRRRNIGFWWFAGQYDSPLDLGERLKKHGLVWAGDNLTMVRLGLDNPVIPVNPDVEVVLLDATMDAETEAALQVSGRCFNWSQDQIDERRVGWFEQVRGTASARDHLLYLAKLGGKPVAFGHTWLKNGLAFLAGAGTLPDCRSRKIYSTLLRRRLVDVAQRGYQAAVVYAGPMSRRVLVRYGFKAYNKFDIYAWMPVMDMAVIKSLIVDE